MPHGDFDVDRLAEYLHVTPDQILKMANRGRIPGRKIGGQWRFSQAEIHHWLEDRIGLYDEDQLARVEHVLKRDLADADELLISELLKPEAMAIPLAARTRSSVISQMVQLAAQSGLLWDPEKMEEAVRSREKLHPTALDNGIALLHPRRPLPSILAEPFLAFGRTQQGIPFGGSGGSLTDLFFLICSIDDGGHLRTLARLSRLIGEVEFVAKLRLAQTVEGACELVRNWERRIQ